MEVLYPRCAGLDVHKDSVVACARIAEGGQVRTELKTFGTKTVDLLQLTDWLTEHGCTHVVMESTGVYWKPVWHILEGCFELVLANAAHVHNVPGRKSDISDAAWLADLLAHGLVRGSFVPDWKTQEVRGLTRTRKQLVREKVQHVQRIQKTLEDGNIKLSSVISNIVGTSGRKMLEAFIGGQADPTALAKLAHPRIQATPKDLREALRGNLTDYHRFELKLHLKLIDEIDKVVTEVEDRIGTAVEPFRVAATRLATIDGVSETTAHVLIGEMGTDMSRFPTAAHLRSWACLCPRMDESAGKRRNTRIQKGATWLKTTLVQAAWATVRVKGSYFRAQFMRLKARRGPKKAIIAVAASMLTTAYHMLKNGVDYQDLGADHFDKRDKAKLTRRLVHRLGDLGYTVELRPAV